MRSSSDSQLSAILKRSKQFFSVFHELLVLQEAVLCSWLFLHPDE